MKDDYRTRWNITKLQEDTIIDHIKVVCRFNAHNMRLLQQHSWSRTGLHYFSKSKNNENIKAKMMIPFFKLRNQTLVIRYEDFLTNQTLIQGLQFCVNDKTYLA